MFGFDGKPGDGALPGGQGLYIEVPPASAPVRIRILDADTRGRHDELDGAADTSTAFLVYGRYGLLLASQVVGRGAADQTRLAFGPFPPEQGDAQDGARVFRIEAQGLAGNDANLFAVEVEPRAAQCYTYQAAVRLPARPGARAGLFPEIPLGTATVRATNYDLDPDGGRAMMILRRRDGSRAGQACVAASASGAWASTTIPVPAGADDARWAYVVEKAGQRNANAAFVVTTGWGHLLRLYTTRRR